MESQRQEKLRKMATWLNANGTLTREQQAQALGIRASTLYWNIAEARKLGFIVREQAKGVMVVPELPPEPRKQFMPPPAQRQALLLPPPPAPMSRR